MASIFVKRGRLWARIKKRGKWTGCVTEFRPGQEEQALARAKELQREANVAVGLPASRGLNEPDDLYLILSSCGAVKIGRAVGPEHRLRTLISHSPPSVMLTLLGVAPGFGRYERALHEHFSEHRVRGEWFSPVLSARLQNDLKSKSLTTIAKEIVDVPVSEATARLAP